MTKNLTQALVACMVKMSAVMFTALVMAATADEAGAQYRTASSNSPVLVMTPDPEEAAKRARAAFVAQDVFFRQPERTQLLDQAWVLGTEMRTCPRASLNFGDFATRLAGVELAVLELDTDEAFRQFVQLDEALPCLTSSVRGEQLWKYYVLQGVTADYAGNSGRAAIAFTRALAVLPGQPIEEEYPPALQQVYAESRTKLLARPRALLVAVKKPLEAPGAVVLDGVHIGDSIAEVLPGEHLLQVRDRSGAWRGGVMTITGTEVIALGLPEDMPRALRLLTPADQKKLAAWISASTKVTTTKVVVHDGHKELVVLGEGISYRRARRLAENAPAFTLAFGGGYQRADVGNYVGWGMDISLKLWKGLRLNIVARPSMSELVVHPATGENLGRMWLLGFGLGPCLRLELPPAAMELGINAQFAPNTGGSRGPKFLVGVVVTAGVDLQLGKSPLFFRPQVEAGVLDRYFTLRGLGFVGVRTGNPNNNAD